MIYILLAIIVGFIVFEIVYIKVSGKPVARPDINRQEQTLGTGAPIRYVILGDSTSISQGGDYDEGYAVDSAHHLAATNTVTWINVGISGARAKDVLENQVPKAAAFRPDVALIAVGANDITHLTQSASVIDSLKASIDQLRQANPAVKIVLTGSPDMGSVPRFAQPVRWYAGVRTNQLNREIAKLAKDTQVVLAPIAAETGPIFRQHPELFAQDKFHPTNDGYALWKPIINRTLDMALQK